MARVLLLILALLEMAAGLFGLFGAAGLLTSHNVGMVTFLWPLLVAIALFFIASASIFLRRPWSYYLHMAIVLLIGALYVFYLGSLAGVDERRQLLWQAVAVVVPLTVVFLLPGVRAHFGVTAPSVA